jgi:hypothetical protein
MVYPQKWQDANVQWFGLDGKQRNKDEANIITTLRGNV